MKIRVNDKDIFELSDIKKKVIQNDIQSEIFDDDMKRRLQYVLMHKYERCFERLKKEWEPILAQRVPSIPTNPDAFAELVFAQTDYKNRSQRDKDAVSK